MWTQHVFCTRVNTVGELSQKIQVGAKYTQYVQVLIMDQSEVVIMEVSADLRV